MSIIKYWRGFWYKVLPLSFQENYPILASLFTFNFRWSFWNYYWSFFYKKEFITKYINYQYKAVTGTNKVLFHLLIHNFYKFDIKTFADYVTAFKTVNPSNGWLKEPLIKIRTQKQLDKIYNYMTKHLIFSGEKRFDSSFAWYDLMYGFPRKRDGNFHKPKYSKLKVSFYLWLTGQFSYFSYLKDYFILKFNRNIDILEYEYSDSYWYFLDEDLQHKIIENSCQKKKF